MNITRYGHACLLVEEGGTRLLVDPGNWNATPPGENIHAILVTHEHGDHFDLEHIRRVKAASPDVLVITHASVATLLEGTGVDALVVEEQKPIDVNGVSVESFGHEHAAIYGNSPCRNTGFLIAGRLFVPGDALHDVPNKPVELLALPTGGPWMKIAEAIDYAKAVKPKIAFPIHDAMQTEDYKRGFIPMLFSNNLKERGIEFRDFPEGATFEF